jgi:hypothetical protein
MKDFIQYEQALALKELGFDEPCQLGWYLPHPEIAIKAGVEPHRWQLIPTHPLLNQILSPTFSQAFRWFREKYSLYTNITKYNDENDTQDKFYHYISDGYMREEFNTYEEAELACLKKLIEIVKTKQL